jgi:hypothetical protein
MSAVKWALIAMIALFVLVGSKCGAAQRDTPPAGSNAVESRPDLSGPWIRLRTLKNFMDIRQNKYRIVNYFSMQSYSCLNRKVC